METGFYFALYMVGMTGLEPATSRPPDACANQLRYIPIDIKRKTNDRKILSVSVFATAKVLTYYENCKFSNIFSSLPIIFATFAHIIYMSARRLNNRATQ